LDWKRKFPHDWCEFWKAGHRADVCDPNGSVIEFQHSQLGPNEIQERESFWENLIWVFDAKEWFGNLELRFQPEKTTFRWKHPRKSVFAARCPVYFDTGFELFEITFLGRNVPCGGKGRFVPYRYFLNLYGGTAFVSAAIDETAIRGGDFSNEEHDDAGQA
jgi:hypothetical protein